MLRYNEVDWDRAGCAEMPTNLFYAFEESRGVRDIMQISMYRNICCACPIWKSCLAYALSNEQFGIWGGLTTHERNAFKLGEISPLVTKVIEDFNDRGIDLDQLLEALLEHSDNERSVADSSTNYGEDDSASNSRSC